MANTVNLARTLAEIASGTRDPLTAQPLMVLVSQLLTEVGLPVIAPEPPVRH
jgi:hypothetical protein